MSGFNAKRMGTYGQTNYAIGLGRLRPTVASVTREYNYLERTSQTPFCSLFDFNCSNKPTPPPPPGPTVPSAPTIVSSTAFATSIQIDFTQPSDGGSAITNYQYSLDNEASWIPFSPPDTSSPVTLTGLVTGQTYNIKLRAVNSVGPGAASSTVTKTTGSVPSAPTGLNATPGNGTIEITFVAGSDGGSPITNYQYTLDNEASWISFSPPDTSSPVTITGLTNGTTYNIKLRAVNAIGNGTASSSVSATPAAAGKQFYGFGPDLDLPSAIASSSISSDNSGNIFVCGVFSSIKKIPSLRFGIYNENTQLWTTFGSTFVQNSGFNGLVVCVVYKSGYVYIGGTFTTVNGLPINGIAKWDGTTWSGLAGGIQTSGGQRVYSIEFDSANNIYVGGDFNNALDNSLAPVPNTSRIVKWDGTSWVSMYAGTGLNGEVRSIVFNSADGLLYVGGAFSNINGVTIGRLATWNGGTSWSSVYGASFNNTVLKICFDASYNLYVGGEFTSVTSTPSITTQYIAKLNSATNQWETLGSDLINNAQSVSALAYNSDTNEVYIGGRFLNIGSTQFSNLAKWNCQTLSYEKFYTSSSNTAYGTVLNRPTASIYISPYSKRTYFTGFFSSYNTLMDVYGTYKIDAVTNQFSSINIPSGQGFVSCIAKYGSDIIFACGSTSREIRKYNPITGTWTTIGTLNSEITCMVAYNSYLYVGGFFTTINGLPCKRFAMYTGSTWIEVGGGVNNAVFGIDIDNTGTNLYVTGRFTTVDPNGAAIPCNGRIAIYNLLTNTFTTFFNGTTNSDIFGCVFDNSNNPYFYGFFTTIDGTSNSYIAKYAGGTWSSIGTLSASVRTAYKNGNYFYFGGSFISINGDTNLRAIAKYDFTTSTWASVSADLPNSPTSNDVVFNISFDASGNMYVFGNFFYIGSTPTYGMAKLNASGTTWTTTLTGGNLGFGSYYRATCIDGSNVYVGGAAAFNSLGQFSQGLTVYY